MSRPLLSPRLLSSLPNHFPSLCTVKTQGYASGGSAGTVGHDSAGYKTKGAGKIAETGTGPDAVLLEDIPCLNAALKEDELAAYSEIAEVTHKCLLSGYYPAITAAMTAIIDDSAWNIVGAEHSAISVFTELILSRRTA